MSHPPTDIADARADTSVGRDRGLDLLRAAALIRVVVWHATGAAAVTVLAAMPVMFFVSGSLFAASAGRRGGWRTVRDRVRRIGPSLWVFAAGAWLLMAIAARVTGTSLDWSHLVSWLVPVTDPVGSAWEGGWLSSPLWYLRTLLWILLLAPALGLAGPAGAGGAAHGRRRWGSACSSGSTGASGGTRRSPRAWRGRPATSCCSASSSPSACGPARPARTGR